MKAGIDRKGYWGAYGFRIIYTPGEGALKDLLEQESTRPVVTLDWRLASSIRTYEIVDGEAGIVSMGAERGSSFHVTRDPPTIAFDLTEPASADAIVHPLGTIPISILARWRGDLTLHGGAFGTEAGAWAVVGQREAGKSTTLATLSERGHAVVADDLLTIQGGFVWSGPACVDLRPDAARRFPRARDLGIIGGRRRYRLSARAASPKIPLRGFFMLGWHERPVVEVSPIPISDKIQMLYKLEYIGLLGPSPAERILDAATLPAWHVLRPHVWDDNLKAVDAMLDVVARHS